MAGVPGSLPLVGRDDALGALVTALGQAVEGAGSLVLLGGDAGIGKTRILQALRERADERDVRALVGHCIDGSGAAPFWPWAQILREWSEDEAALGLVEELGSSLSVLAAVFPELRDRFPNLPAPPSLEGEPARFRVLDAATSVLRRSARKRPLLVVLEDVHWADEGSLRLLSFAARDLAAAPVLLVASLRETQVEEGDTLSVALADLARAGTTLSLAGLDDDAVAALWRAATGAPPSEALARRVCARTGGNPLFVLETARNLRDPTNPVEAGEIALPRGIRQALRPRIARRSEACRRVLEAAAVVGEAFSLDLLTQIVSDDGTPAETQTLLEPLAEARDAELLARTPGSDVRHHFTHALVRELLYDDLGASQQIALHARVAAALASGHATERAHLAELAHHACRAAPAGGGEDAIAHARRAAEDALARQAPEDAAHFFGRALDVLHLMPEPRPELHGDLLTALGQAQARSGRRREAVESLTRAAELARETRSPERLARVALAFPAAHTSMTMSSSMGGERAHALLREALDGLPDGPDRLRIRVLSRLARGDAAGSERAAEAVAHARELGDPECLAIALDAQHYVLWGAEHAHQRLAIAAELDRLGRERRDPFTCFRAGHAAVGDQLELGDRRALRATLDRLDHLVDELRQPALRLVPFHARACQVFLDGDLEGYERMIRQGLAEAQRAGGSDALAVFSGQLSMLRREQARLDELRGNLEAVVARFPDVPAYALHLAWIHAEADRPADARRALGPVAQAGVEAIPRDGFLLLNLYFAGEVAASIEDGALGGAVYERLLPYAGRAVVLGPVLCFGAADRTLGRLAALAGRDEAALAHFERALDLDAGMEARPCLAHSRIEAARHLLARAQPGDAERAGRLLDEAGADAARHGLTLAAARVRELRDDAPQASEPGGDRDPDAREEAHRMHFEGDTWLVGFAGHEVRLKATKGLACLATLLAEPGREFAALELASDPGAGTLAGDAADPVLDPEAFAAYRARMDALREELAEAERFDDMGRTARLQEEMERIADEVAAGVGLGGRARRAAGPAERARKAVYNRIRSAIARIDTVHAPLARHLEASVRTGRLCSYRPERPTNWRVS